MREVTASSLAGNAHPTLARLRAEHPVTWVESLDGWLVTSHEHSRQVLRDAERFTVEDPRFSTARLLGPSMLSLDGDEHDRHRRPFSGAFRPGEIRALAETRIRDEALRLVSRFRDHGAAELRREFAAPLATAAMMTVLGLEDLDPVAFAGLYSRLVVTISELGPDRPVGADGETAWRLLRDRLAVAAGSQRLEGLDAAEAVRNHAVLLFGGIDTTEGMITNAVLHILPSANSQEIAADPLLLAAAVEESLRLEPTAARVDRYATVDVELGGSRVRRGDLVMVSLSAANRDPAVFVDPDTFDPRRTNARDHLAFVVGPHFCIGAHLARLETLLAVETLFTLPGLHLNPAYRPHATGLVFRKPTSLQVLWNG